MNLTSSVLQNIIIFSLLGFICFRYNEPVAKEMSKLFLVPLKWLIGEEGKWYRIIEKFVVLTARAVLYSGVVISVIVLLLSLATVINTK